MVIQEAEHLRLGVVTFEDERMQDEPPDRSRFSDPDFSDEDKCLVAEELAQNWEYNGSSSIAYRLGRVWRDGLGVLSNDEKAEVSWLSETASPAPIPTRPAPRPASLFPRENHCRRCGGVYIFPLNGDRIPAAVLYI